jgi:HSP20 family protein
MCARFLRGTEPSLQVDAHFQVPVDIIERKDELILLFDLPGVGPKDIEITATANSLTIRGERKAWNELHSKSERWKGGFSRRLILPLPANIQKVHARMLNGVLAVYVPKAASVEERVEVRVTTGDPALDREPSMGTPLQNTMPSETTAPLHDDESPPYHQEFPNAFYAEDLSQLSRHNYIVVVRLSENCVERIIESQLSDSINFDQMLAEIEKALSKLRAKYPSSQYDIVLGQGDLHILKNALPTVFGWETITTETIHP